MIFRRFIHRSSSNAFFVSNQILAGSPLANLRKKTGYSISNCKKALEVTGNDLVKVFFFNYIIYQWIQFFLNFLKMIS